MTTEQLLLPIIDGVPTGYRAERLTMANLDDSNDWLLYTSSSMAGAPKGRITDLPDLARRMQTDERVYHDEDGNIFIGSVCRVIRVRFDAGPIVRRVTLRRAGREAFVTGAVLMSPHGSLLVLDRVAPDAIVYCFCPDNPESGRRHLDIYPFYSNKYLDDCVLYVEPDNSYVLK